MSMPETAIYKNDTMVFRQDNIWFSWQVFYMQAETEASVMKQTAD